MSIDSPIVRLVDYLDLLQAVYDFYAEEEGITLIDWENKAEQEREIEKCKAEMFKANKRSYDHLLSTGFTDEERKELDFWIKAARESIKEAIEIGLCRNRSSVRLWLLNRWETKYLRNSTIHLRGLLFSLFREPLNIAFPSWEEYFSEEPLYSIDPKNQNIICEGGSVIELKGKPRQVFDLLADQGPGIVSIETIFTSIWEGDSKSDLSVVRAYVLKIRKAFKDKDIIEMTYGKGYRLCLRPQK